MFFYCPKTSFIFFRKFTMTGVKEWGRTMEMNELATEVFTSHYTTDIHLLTMVGEACILFK